MMETRTYFRIIHFSKIILISPARTTPIPRNLSSKSINGDVYLSWHIPDNLPEIDTNNLTYNFYIGTSKGQCNIVSPMANLENGYRKIARKGNASDNKGWKIKNLPPGKYYWSVQAISPSFSGSPFAQIDSIEVRPTGVLRSNRFVQREIKDSFIA